ncbi:MAG TPA: hypothetical protein VF092_29860 [Longimicrobium sp.]
MRNFKLMTVAAAVLACAALAACGESEARKEARAQARRSSCVASELALEAKERLASLDTQVVRMQGSPLEQVTNASHLFAAAYKSYADAKSRAADLADSAAVARSKNDSVRLAGESQRARPPAPQPGVQQNAAERFEADMREALANPDHPCNKQGEDGES